MRRFAAVVVWMALAGGAVRAQAPAAAPKAAPTKIGVIDVVRALSDTQEGKREFAVIQEWANKENESLQKMQGEHGALQEQYMQQQLQMAPDARADMERRLRDSETRLTRRQEDLNQELNQRRQDLLGKMGNKLGVVVQEYAQQNNYLAVLVAQEGMFAYVAPVGDLTEEVRKLYDARYPVKQAAAPAAAPAPAPAPAPAKP